MPCTVGLGSDRLHAQGDKGGGADVTTGDGLHYEVGTTADEAEEGRDAADAGGHHEKQRRSPSLSMGGVRSLIASLIDASESIGDTFCSL